MSYWLFKVADQEYYRDKRGKEYVYDNTHSIRVAPKDIFLYLDKREKYSFTGTGSVSKITNRHPSKKEAHRNRKVRTVFTAKLQDMIWFTEPLTINPSSKLGKRNRTQLGITNANLLGWSQSIPGDPLTNDGEIHQGALAFPRTIIHHD